MNLVELQELILAIPIEEAALLPYYLQRRDELVADINKALAALGLPVMDAKELLLLSPRPDLAATV